MFHLITTQRTVFYENKFKYYIKQRTKPCYVVIRILHKNKSRKASLCYNYVLANTYMIEGQIVYIPIYAWRTDALRGYEKRLAKIKTPIRVWSCWSLYAAIEKITAHKITVKNDVDRNVVIWNYINKTSRCICSHSPLLKFRGYKYPDVGPYLLTELPHNAAFPGAQEKPSLINE